MTIKTIADITDTDLILVTDSQEVSHIKGLYPKNHQINEDDYDCLFVDGEGTPLWGFYGRVPFNHYNVWEVTKND